jgi:CRP-like cAMP-binding protein
MSTIQKTFNLLRALYRRMVRRQENARTREIVDTLKQVPVFQELSRGALHTLAEAMHLRDYRRDEFLYYERDPGLGLYLVQRGCIRLLTEDEEGNVHELRQVCDREVFGELSILGEFRRMETAQAVGEARVLGFFRPDLRTMIKRHPKAGADALAAVARLVAARQSELVRRLAEREGKVAAMRLLDGAAVQAAVFNPDGPALP